LSFTGTTDSSPIQLLLISQHNPGNEIQQTYWHGVTSGSLDTSGLTPGETYTLSVWGEYTDSNNVLYSETTSLTFTAVPEPATCALGLAAAGLGLAVATRLRRRAANR
jgi:hypothetical protein